MGPLNGARSPLGPVLGPVLTEVRERAPAYRRWWARRPSADPEPTPPWSEGDEERLTQLGSLDPWWLRSMAGELERVGRDVDGVSDALAGLARDVTGSPAAVWCAGLAASGRRWAHAAGELAAGMREIGDRVDELLGGAARRVLRVLEERPAPDASFTGHAAVLRAVRAELRAGAELLAELAAPTWCPGELGCPDPGVASRWRSGRTTWASEPGDGPHLPAVVARRAEPGLGVRIARLPG